MVDSDVPIRDFTYSKHKNQNPMKTKKKVFSFKYIDVLCRGNLNIISCNFSCTLDISGRDFPT